MRVCTTSDMFLTVPRLFTVRAVGLTTETGRRQFFAKVATHVELSTGNTYCGTHTPNKRKHTDLNNYQLEY